MSCHHNRRRYGHFNSMPDNSRSAHCGAYWVCTDCGLVHIDPADMTHFAHYYPDRFAAILDRLRSETADPADISDLWTGKYKPQPEESV